MASVTNIVDLDRLAEQLKILAEPRRLRIFSLLMEGVQCNCELGEALDMAPNLISHHLGVLRKSGLIDVQRELTDARWVYYSVNRGALADLNGIFGVFFDPDRIEPRQPRCGPYRADIALVDTYSERG